MFDSREVAIELLKDLLREQYEAFWAEFKEAIAELVERGYLR